MTTLHQTNVDGVQCFWVDSGRPTLSAGLMFRCGIADEPLQESGWLHMLEHLALHDRGGGALHVNGSVTPLLTMFESHGPADQVVDHLTGVTRWHVTGHLSGTLADSRATVKTGRHGSPERNRAYSIRQP